MKRYSVLSIFFVFILLTSAACNLLDPSTLGQLQNALIDQIEQQAAPQETTNEQPLAPVNLSASPFEQNLAGLYQKTIPGVVSIQIISQNGGGLGTGFVVDQDGHIVTNEHVIDGATAIEVDFHSGYKTTATLVGADKDSDIAVIKVDAPSSELHPLPLGDSRTAMVGQSVVAIGNPFGLSGTMTLGIVSALGRTQDSNREATSGGNFSVADMIQTDAAINPGNSGGPLLNLAGEVIGINRSIRTGNSTAQGEASNSGIGFALPINLAKRVVPAIIQFGKFEYPYMGISTLNSEMMSLHVIQQLGLQKMTGVYVTDVQPGGPADLAGIRGASTDTSLPGLLSGGDLIIGIDGNEVKIYDDLIGYLVEFKSPGDTITLTVLRGSETLDLELELVKRP